MLSIRTSSEFVIGAALLREKGMETTGDSENFTIQEIAFAAFSVGNGAKVRQSITKLSGAEDAWFRSTPPHVLVTEKVLESRTNEIKTFAAVNTAVISAFKFGAEAETGNDSARAAIKDSFVAAVESIDNAPGSVADKKQFYSLLRDQINESPSNKTLLDLLKVSEVEYNDRLKASILARYSKLSRSDDYDH